MTALKLIDIAVNLTDPMFRGCYNGSLVAKHAEDLIAVLDRAVKSGVTKIMATGTSLAESRESIHLAEKYSRQDLELYATVGCHPTKCQEFLANNKPEEEYYADLKRLALSSEKVVAIGECGLDYDRLQFCPKDIQQKYFIKQLELAQECDLPVFLHNRNTDGDFYRIVRQYRPLFGQGVCHSFDGSLEEMHQLTRELDLYIGINGCSMRSDDNLRVIRELPLERLMIETDAPWCEIRPSHASFSLLEPENSSPIFQSMKKERFQMGFMVKGRNEPCQVRKIVKVIAAVKGLDTEQVAAAAYENTMKVFFASPKTF